MDNVAKKFAAEQYIFDCDISALMKEFQNSSGPTKYKSIIQSYMSYRQCKQVIHSKQSLTNFMILEMSNLRMEPIRFNSTTFSGRVDLLDHIICMLIPVQTFLHIGKECKRKLQTCGQKYDSYIIHIKKNENCGHTSLICERLQGETRTHQ